MSIHKYIAACCMRARRLLSLVADHTPPFPPTSPLCPLPRNCQQGRSLLHPTPHSQPNTMDHVWVRRCMCVCVCARACVALLVHGHAAPLLHGRPTVPASNPQRPGSKFSHTAGRGQLRGPKLQVRCHYVAVTAVMSCSVAAILWPPSYCVMPTSVFSGLRCGCVVLESANTCCCACMFCFAVWMRMRIVSAW